MQLGDEDWVAQSAKARIKGARLSVDLAGSSSAGTVTTRGQVKLILADFDGPGAYVAGQTSMFIVVTIDRAALQDRAESTDSPTAGSKQAVSATDIHMLNDAQVVITSVNKTEVEGTFEWTPPVNGPSTDLPVTNGKFRALVK